MEVAKIDQNQAASKTVAQEAGPVGENFKGECCNARHSALPAML
jgi:hypothetical protein